MKNLFEMLQAIFGKNIISRTIGTRTNVIKLPLNKSSPLKNEFDVVRSSENPAVFEKLKKVIEDEAPYISRMNDAERLIYEGNVKRLHDYLVSIGEIKPTITADVVGLTTKEPISGKGLESLVEEAGQTSPPGTLVGDIQSRINRLKNLTKEEGTTMQDVVGDFASGQKGMLKLRDEGLVRSTARQIMFNDIKSGKLKPSKEVQDIVSGTASGDPIDSFRTIYGEDALEQLDSLTPDLRQLRTEVDAEKLARSKFEFTPKLDRPKESYTPEEMKKILETEPEEFAKGGSVGLDYLTGQDSKVERKNYGFGSMIKAVVKEPIAGLMIRLDRPPQPGDPVGSYYIPPEDGSGLRAIIRAVPQPSSPPPVTTPVVRPEDEILMRYREYMNASKPSQSDLENKYRELVQGKADGGRIGFNIGGGKKILDLIAEMNKKLKDKKSMEKLDPRTGEVTTLKEPVTTADKIKRKPTKEEYEEYAEILDDSENTVVQGNETFEQLDALVKKQKDYEDYMYMQYKRGKLDPEPGEKTQDRLNFLRKKSEEAGMIGDRRLFTFNEMKELEDLERAFSSMGVAKNKISEAEMIKQKYGNVIDDNLLQQILIDDNPQRKAEVMATIDEALKMQQKGIGPEQIMDIIKNTTRTKQAKGGSVGLGYLAGE